jgi:hypothetical protein
MAQVRCSQCGGQIPAADVNVGADVAYCRACNTATSLSDLAAERLPDARVDTTNPPAGCWHRPTVDGVEIGASCRSLSGAVGALVLALFWNGIVSVFVLVALGATIRHVSGSVPHWFPAPKMDGNDMGVGMTLFLWVFLLPFIGVGVMMAGAVVMMVAGSVRVRVGRERCEVFTGVGPLGWTSRIDAGGVKGVRLEDRSWRDSDGDRRTSRNIIVEAEKTVKFGSMLTAERRSFVAGALAREVVPGR